MPKKMSNKKPKKLKIKTGVKDTGMAKVGKINLVGNLIDIEGSLKKNKEVKESDVFDFSYKPKN
tara:strand:- start:101 stop:292 length:192 start_codon:yes stop_codon:yes gene_type:complete